MTSHFPISNYILKISQSKTYGIDIKVHRSMEQKQNAEINPRMCNQAINEKRAKYSKGKE